MTTISIEPAIEPQDAARWRARRLLASRRPPLRPQPVRPADPRAWSGSDTLWELYQEQAATAFRAGESIAPAQHWERALELAERSFPRGDPRLATSLANQAFVLRRRCQMYPAMHLLYRAVEVWDDCWRWLEVMAPPEPAEQACLRLEGETPQAALTKLAARGRAATMAMLRHQTPDEDPFPLWLELRPEEYDDLRKLLAAVLLIVPAAE